MTDMKKGSKVTIVAIRGVVKMCFESTVVEILEEGLLIERLECENMALDFNVSSNVILFAVLVGEDEKPFEWREIDIKQVYYKGEKYSLLNSNSEGKFVNRRKSFRIYLGLNGIVQIGVNRSADEVIVKDISETGVALISKKDIDFKVGDTLPMRLTFSDAKLNMHFSLFGEVRRKVKLDEDKFLYGCLFLGQHDKVRKYVALKQQTLLSGKNAYRYKR